MSIRLQVVLDEREMQAIRRDAKRHGMTVSEWVRQALRAARSGAEPSARRLPVRIGTGRVSEAPAGYKSSGADVLRPFIGKWVALAGDEVLVAGDDPREVVAWLRRRGRRADTMFRVPIDPAADLGGFPG